MTDDILEYIKRSLSKERFLHSLGVVSVVRKFAKFYPVDIKRLEIAALLHDSGKDVEIENQLKFLSEYNISLADDELKCSGILHAYVSEVIARERFGINDEEILKAIRFHPSGHPDFNLFQKILFAADYLDPVRKLKRRREIFKLAVRDIDRGLIEIIREKIDYIISNGEFLHHLTVGFYNSLIKKL